MLLMACGTWTAVEGQSAETELLKEQRNQIEAADAELRGVYQKILAALHDRIVGGDQTAVLFKDALVKAEAAWMRWRDAEALLRAYAGGAVGGSALREDVHQNLLSLIAKRKEYMQKLLEGIQ
jgi:uncharacterized protein YecT (DUF1311 family)